MDGGVIAQGWLGSEVATREELEAWVVERQQKR